jgi:hypothetical protein
MSDPNAHGKPLDARLREQVAELHQGALEAQSPLGEQARARVLAALRKQAGQLNAARKRRYQLRIGGGSLLMAAAAAALLYVRAPRPTPALREPQAARGLAACTLPVLSATAFEADGVQVTLGALGNLVTQRHSTLRVEHSSACELALRLEAGTLAGELHNLRPARLIIRTAEAEVIVTGTRFSVNSGDTLEVLLASGVVDVHLRDQKSLRLSPGTRLRKAPRAEAATEPLSQTDSQRLSGWLEPPREHASAAISGETASAEPAAKPAVHTPSIRELLDAAEAARRAMRWSAAREAYRSASQGRDADAEIALLRWANMELERRAANAALRVLGEHARRYPRGTLGAEAGWLEVRARLDLGQAERAEQAARKLRAQHAGTPQAKAASKLLDAK